MLKVRQLIIILLISIFFSCGSDYLIEQKENIKSGSDNNTGITSKPSVKPSLNPLPSPTDSPSFKGYIIYAVAGNGIADFGGDNDNALSAYLSNPYGIVADELGNIYISDKNNNRIRKIDIGGRISTIAGGGTVDSDGIAVNAVLYSPTDIVLDSEGNLLILETEANRLRKLDKNGSLSTIVTSGLHEIIQNKGLQPLDLGHPQGLALDLEGNIYISDTDNNIILKIDKTGKIYNFCGRLQSGNYFGDGGDAVNASLNSPKGLAIDKTGNLYIADSNNHRVRKVDKNNNKIMTIAGDGNPVFKEDNHDAVLSSVNTPSSVALDKEENLYIADAGNNLIRKIDKIGIMTTIAGCINKQCPVIFECKIFPFTGKSALQSSIAYPNDVFLDNVGNIYFTQANWANKLIFLQ